MAEGRYKLLLICLVSLTVVLLSIAGGLGGCGKDTGPAGNGEENGEGNGAGDGDGTRTEGFSGVAFVRDDHIYLGAYIEEKEEITEQRLTSAASGYGNLAFSPRGTKLAATKVEGDAMPQMVIIDIRTGKMTEVSWTNEDYSSAWNEADLGPWFGSIAWESEDAFYCTAQRSEGGEFRFFVVKCDLSVPSVEIVDVDACNPALSPDGKRLAYIAKPLEWAEIGAGSWGNLDPGDLMVMDLASGESGKVSVNQSGAQRGYVFDAAFSPDGKHMAVNCFDEPDTVLYFTDLEGSIVHALDMVGPGGRIGQPSFSPGGEHVIYHIAWRDLPDAPFEYTMLAAPTAEANPETIDLGEGSYPSWSPVEGTRWPGS